MNEKKSYQKPQVNRVKFAVDEAVLGGCKTTPADTSAASGNCCTASATPYCSATTGT